MDSNTDPAVTTDSPVVPEQDPSPQVSEPWFDSARIIDRQWVEFKVTTSLGERISYHIPRKTIFEPADQQPTRS